MGPVFGVQQNDRALKLPVTTLALANTRQILAVQGDIGWIPAQVKQVEINRTIMV